MSNMGSITWSNNSVIHHNLPFQYFMVTYLVKMLLNTLLQQTF